MKHLEEFVLSKSDRTVLETVEIDEFDDILKYVNELFERVTEQARFVVNTQQHHSPSPVLISGNPRVNSKRQR